MNYQKLKSIATSKLRNINVSLILLICLSVAAILGIGYVAFKTIGNFVVIPAIIIGVGLLTGITGGPQK